MSESSTTDVIERIIRYQNDPGKKNASTLLLRCKDEIEYLRKELSKEMRETFWMRSEIDRLQELLRKARRDF